MYNNYCMFCDELYRASSGQNNGHYCSPLCADMAKKEQEFNAALVASRQDIYTFLFCCCLSSLGLGMLLLL